MALARGVATCQSRVSEDGMDERCDLRLRDLGVTMRGDASSEDVWFANLPIDVSGNARVEYERAPAGAGYEGGQFALTIPHARFEGEWCDDFDDAWNSLLDVIDRWSPPLALEIRRLEWSYQERVKRAEMNGETLTEEEEAAL